MYKNLNIMIKYIIAICIFLAGTNLVCQAQESIISEEVKENIKFRVENGINTGGIVVGVVTSEGTTFFSYGVKSLKSKELVDENSVFEIGSITKTFTGILLADMVIKGDLNLDDPLQNLLPEGITAPTRNGESIRLYQLSNHTSSLPSMPNNLTPDRGNPFANYSEELLYAFIDGYELTRDIGSEYEYSNYAQGLLGYLLANKSQMSYEDLMVEHIAKPLELENTRIHLTPNMKENLAMGHNNGIEVENWDLDALASAGGIRSTAVDMLNYLAANMGIKKSNLYSAMQLSHKNSRSEGSTPIVGLAWHTRFRDELEIVLHTGGTGGYATFAGFIKDGDKGVVVLSNSTAGVYDIGIHLLHPASALNKPNIPIGANLKIIIENEGIETATRTYWELKENQTDKYDFGENQLNSLGYSYLGEEEIEKAKAVFKINTEAFPNSANAYDSYGEALLQNNEKEKAIANYKKSVELNPGNTTGIEMLKKLGVDTEKFLVKEVAVDDAILESYVGKYELAPGFILTLAKYGSQLKAQATGQTEVPVFPKSQNEFYYKVVDAQLIFNLNKDGNVESVTLHQNGQVIIGKKLAD
jgi:CubicO group peptidase (beta-lactamase class C family)